MIGRRGGIADWIRPVSDDRREVWDLDAGTLPDGRDLDDALIEFRDWVDVWSAGSSGDSSSAWLCPASWRGAAAAEWIERGARIVALGCALQSIKNGVRVKLVTGDPILGRLARRLVSKAGQPDCAIRVVSDSSSLKRLRSRLEPVLMMMWWVLTASCRILHRRRVTARGDFDLLHLEPLVAGVVSTSRHNWGSFDPTVGRRRSMRIQVPVGFGTDVRSARRAMASMSDAVLPEDLSGLGSLLRACCIPVPAARRWPRRASFRGVELGDWSRAMRYRLCFSTTLQAAAFVDAAVRSFSASAEGVAGAACWFENQPQERAFVQAVRGKYPGCAIDGYLLFHFGACSHGAIVPSQRDCAASCIPDVIHCCGPVQQRWLSRVCPWVTFKEGPAGRFRWSASSWSPAHRVLLIVTPSLDRAAVKMLAIAIQAAPRIPRDWTMSVRLHPASGAAVRELAESSAMAVDRNGSLEAAIAASGMVAGAGSSAVVVARAMGWPVAVLVPDGLPNMDPFPPGHGLEGVFVVRRADELSSAIEAVAGQRRALSSEQTLFLSGPRESALSSLTQRAHPLEGRAP